MTTTYTPGYGGTLTVNSATIPVQNMTVDYSRAEMDVTATSDAYTYSMAGRITRKFSCTALITSATQGVITALMATTPGTSVALSWNDGNSGTYSVTKVMLVSASHSYDNSGAATVQLQFSEAISS